MRRINSHEKKETLEKLNAPTIECIYNHSQKLDEQERVKKLEKEVKERRKQNKEDLQGSLPPYVFKLKQVEFKMIHVKVAPFVMGATSEQGEDAKDDEKPAHIVTLTNDYWIGETPVTQALWEVVMGYNPSYFAKKGIKSISDFNRPVEVVTWIDCQDFIAKLNQRAKEKHLITDLEFCFPTEAEWEFAARGGIYSKGYKYAGSKDISDVAWCNDKETHPVAETKKPNELGLYDMSGNVWEWCKDRYSENGYREDEQKDPEGPENGNRRVARGGSSHCDPSFCRVSKRGHGNIHHAGNGLGLRLVLKKKKQ